MSHYGQVKKFLPFRAMSKQCEFSTLQGVSNQVTHQTHPSTADNDRHHPNTPYTSSKHHLDRSMYTLIDITRNKLTKTNTNRLSHTFSNSLRCWLMLAVSYILTSHGVCWHVLASFVVWRYLDGVWGVVWDVKGVKRVGTQNYGAYQLRF